jgi:hypothetical protein
MRNIAGRLCREIKPHIIRSVTFLKNRVVYDNVEKYCTVGETTDYNMAHPHFTLDA